MLVQHGHLLIQHVDHTLQPHEVGDFVEVDHHHPLLAGSDVIRQDAHHEVAPLPVHHLFLHHHARLQGLAQVVHQVGVLELMVQVFQRPAEIAVAQPENARCLRAETDQFQCLVHKHRARSHHPGEVVELRIGPVQDVDLFLVFGVDGVELLVDGLQLFVGALQLLVRGHHLLVGGLQLFVRCFQFLDRGLQAFAGDRELVLQRPDAFAGFRAQIEHHTHGRGFVKADFLDHQQAEFLPVHIGGRQGGQSHIRRRLAG